MQVPGGYLCRDDVGELKYMLAFPSPAVSVGRRSQVAQTLGNIEHRGPQRSRCRTSASLRSPIFYVAQNQPPQGPNVRCRAKSVPVCPQGAVPATSRRAPAPQAAAACVVPDAGGYGATPCPTCARAQAAVAWCLVMQEATMYADWPDFVVRYERFRAVLGPDRELLFRGPRWDVGTAVWRDSGLGS